MGILLPQFLGILIGVATLRVFNTTLESRIKFCSDMPIFAFLLHWAIGFIFFLHIKAVRDELRMEVRRDLLTNLLPHPSNENPEGEGGHNVNRNAVFGANVGGVGRGAVMEHVLNGNEMVGIDGLNGDINGININGMNRMGQNENVRRGNGNDRRLHRVADTPVNVMLERALFSVVIFVPAVLVAVVIPFRLGHWLVPGMAAPLRLTFSGRWWHGMVWYR